MLPVFITSSNIQSSNPTSVSHGNERVIRPRLSDAEFFWQQDNKLTLEQRVDSLNNVVFQHKLGSLGEMLEPMGPVSFDEAVDCFAQQAGFLAVEGLAVFRIETIFE